MTQSNYDELKEGVRQIKSLAFLSLGITAMAATSCGLIVAAPNMSFMVGLPVVAASWMGCLGTIAIAAITPFAAAVGLGDAVMSLTNGKEKEKVTEDQYKDLKKEIHKTNLLTLGSAAALAAGLVMTGTAVQGIFIVPVVAAASLAVGSLALYGALKGKLEISDENKKESATKNITNIRNKVFVSSSNEIALKV